ncbi:MAG: TauD/TfdA family dioxygenase [Alphaproteobacteria bacterium]|jgi:alpha-ketoglutarate-dependent 2,4-dichlorophenoxyacetate dioxygenase|nr:TauD/TfdA family dioxygenase [Alphaproteobacteria bacterium]
MSIEIRPLHEMFGAEIVGVDATKPLSAAEFVPISDAFETYSVLLFRGPVLSDEQQIALSKHFGHVQVAFKANQTGGSMFSRQSNINFETNEIFPPDHHRITFLKANMLWHSDSSYMDCGSLCSVLAAREVPPTGGNTEVVSTRVAWEELPENLKSRIENLSVVHSLSYARDKMDMSILTDEARAAAPPVKHPLVQVNPKNGKKSMLIGAHAAFIDGWSEEDSRELLDELVERASPPQNIYSHEWQDGDVIVWDNRCVLHRATPFESDKYRRHLERTTITDRARL